jgi:hypothetical protein
MEGLSRSLPLFVGFLICAVSILCVAGHQARDYIYNQGASPLPDTEEGKALLWGGEEEERGGFYCFFFGGGVFVFFFFGGGFLCIFCVFLIVCGGFFILLFVVSFFCADFPFASFVDACCVVHTFRVV